jgi:hypothetical protein
MACIISYLKNTQLGRWTNGASIAVLFTSKRKRGKKRDINYTYEKHVFFAVSPAYNGRDSFLELPSEQVLRAPKARAKTCKE